MYEHNSNQHTNRCYCHQSFKMAETGRGDFMHCVALAQKRLAQNNQHCRSAIPHTRSDWRISAACQSGRIFSNAHRSRSQKKCRWKFFGVKRETLLQIQFALDLQGDWKSRTHRTLYCVCQLLIFPVNRGFFAKLSHTELFRFVLVFVLVSPLKPRPQWGSKK